MTNEQLTDLNAAIKKELGIDAPLRVDSNTNGRHLISDQQNTQGNLARVIKKAWLRAIVYAAPEGEFCTHQVAIEMCWVSNRETHGCGIAHAWLYENGKWSIRNELD